MSLTDAAALLNEKERLYAESRLRGLGPLASMQAAGYKVTRDSRLQITDLERDPRVQAVIKAGLEKWATKAMFGRQQAHDLLMEAWHNCEKPSDQIKVAKALIDLHGVAAPKQLTVKHTSGGAAGELHLLTVQELEALALGAPLEAEFQVVDPVRQLEHHSGG